MLRKCICGTYVYGNLKLCRKCAAIYGDDWQKWPGHVRWEYQNQNFRDNDEWALDLSEFFGSEEYVERPPKEQRKGTKSDKEVGTLLGSDLNVKKRCPICQKPINPKHMFCKKHYEEYGKDRSKWPPWLQEIVTMDQADADYEKTHKVRPMHDETYNKPDVIAPAKTGINRLGGSTGTRTQAYTNKDEISQEALVWSDDAEWQGQDMPIPSTDFTDGQKYNDAVWHGSYAFRETGGYGERDDLDAKLEIQLYVELLPEKERTVYLLYTSGYKQWEIADTMQLSQQRVSEIINTVKRELAKRIR